MLIPPVPADEDRRLARLKGLGILDTLPQQAFDDISALAQAICGTPIALVTLIDRDRQWFKSRIGVDMAETPRELAFCSHAILQPDTVMVVEDPQADERFRDHPFVAGDPEVRFYAGAPIVTDDGLPLGTVCVIDQQARHLSEAQIESLRRLSRLVITLIEHERDRARLSAQAEADARQRTEQLAAMATAGLDLQAYIDRNHVYLHVNQTYLDYHGLRREDVIGRRVDEHLDPQTYRDLVNPNLRRAMDGEPVFYERVAVYPALGARHMEVALLPVRDARGLVAGVVMRAHDIEALKRNETRLQDTVAALERKTAELQRFIQILSHDLREPINTINNFSLLLDEDHRHELPDAAHRYLDFVRAGGRRMAALLDDLLGYVRLDQGDLARDPVPLDRVVAEVVADLDAALRRSGGHIDQAPLPVVRGDASLLRVALQNLIVNGLKFVTPGQAPRVRVWAERTPTHHLLHVEDNGIGISADHQARIFDMFTRLHPRQVYDGSGLGLSICLRIAELHGGHLTVASRPGAGSVFTLHLPAADALPITP